MADFSYSCSPQGAAFILTPLPREEVEGDVRKPGLGASLTSHPGLTLPNWRGAAPSCPQEPPPHPQNGLPYPETWLIFSFNAFVFIEQIFAFEKLGVSAFFFFFLVPSLPASLLLQRREPISFRDVCAYRLCHPYVTCFEEKCFRCGCVLL